VISLKLKGATAKERIATVMKLFSLLEQTFNAASEKLLTDVTVC
jgi:hypothetical protein